MNTDFRLSAGYFEHPKVQKLSRKLGDTGVLSHIRLLRFVAVNRPDGDLSGMDALDVALAGGFIGDENAFLSVLVDTHLLDSGDGDALRVHDWADHNEYAATAPQRKSKASAAANARWGNADTPAPPADVPKPPRPPKRGKSEAAKTEAAQTEEPAAPDASASIPDAETADEECSTENKQCSEHGLALPDAESSNACSETSNAPTYPTFESYVPTNETAAAASPPTSDAGGSAPPPTPPPPQLLPEKSAAAAVNRFAGGISGAGGMSALCAALPANFAPPALPPLLVLSPSEAEAQSVAAVLEAAGCTRQSAEELVAEALAPGTRFTLADICCQIEWMPHRKAKNPGYWLPRYIREGWQAPDQVKEQVPKKQSEAKPAAPLPPDPQIEARRVYREALMPEQAEQLAAEAETEMLSQPHWRNGVTDEARDGRIWKAGLAMVLDRLVDARMEKTNGNCQQ